MHGLSARATERRKAAAWGALVLTAVFGLGHHPASPTASAPAAASASAAASAPAAPIDMAGKTCTASECHDVLKTQRFVHSPVIEDDCGQCHVQAGASGSQPSTAPVHRFETIPATLALCGKCHKDASLSRKIIHAPFRDQCTECHDPHGGKVRFFLKADSAGDLCLRCHADLLENRSFIHAPVALKECEACHDSHTSDYPGLLARPPENLCVFCHVNFKTGMDRAVSVHEPARGACWQCHDPHGGMARGFLPATEGELCRKCHEDVMTRMEQARYPHHAMIEGKPCSQCHDPHWAQSTQLLKGPSMPICLQCHSQTIQAADGRTLDNVGAELAEGRYQHGPIRQQDCTPCHATHGSDDPRLLKLAFPLGFYAPYAEGAYALCFSCHDPRIAAEEISLATGFRNGDRNLHYVHVHQEKGRSCRACHHEHASEEPFHIRDWTPFGEWKLKIQYQQTPDGGVCLAACHAPRSYDRQHPVELSAPGGEEP
ncbi:MAG: hypothetical protein NTW86_13410 [Candidatus Sumerlaeota bacterium]|nr:hypothetical protein [Candidatus Sumerlaeota bacterium]